MDKLKIWYDPEGDYLEIMFSQGAGEFLPTSSQNVMVKVGSLGQMTGFAIMNVSQVESCPFEVDIPLEELKGLLKQYGVQLELKSLPS
jgi:uncharacterized protein YuzE